jgi:hypothetical protein
LPTPPSLCGLAEYILPAETAKSDCLQLARGPSAVGVREITYRLHQIHAIEQVEDLGTELKLAPRAKQSDGEGAANRQIDGCQAGAAVGVAPSGCPQSQPSASGRPQREDARQEVGAICSEGPAERRDVGVS